MKRGFIIYCQPAHLKLIEVYGSNKLRLRMDFFVKKVLTCHLLQKNILVVELNAAKRSPSSKAELKVDVRWWLSG